MPFAKIKIPVFLLAFASFFSPGLLAQLDSIKSGVFAWENMKAAKTPSGERRQVLHGTTLDLADLSIHASTLLAGHTNHSPRAHTEYEELVIVKDGELDITINGTVKRVSAGGLAMIVAGDTQSFSNASSKAVTYYVLRLKSKKPVNMQRGKQAGGTLVKNWDELVTRKTEKGESRSIFDRPSSMFGRFEVHATALNPGFASHDPHRHRAEEIILMIKGDVTFQIGQEFHKASAGDLVFLASGDLHATTNSGTSQCGYFAIQWLNDLPTTPAKTTTSPSTDTSSIIASGSKLQLISSQFSFTEGPAVDSKGAIFFTDQPNDKIWKYDTDGKLSLFMEKTGRSNGLHFDRKGNLLACADEKNELWSISPNKKVKVLISGYKGSKLNGPNDLWVAPGGGIYLTDPYYQRPYWTREKPEISGEKVYYLPRNKKELQVVDENLVKPNGIVGTPDGRYLYVADLGDKKTYKYTIERDGSLKDRKLFVAQGSDGMTLDNKGNLYITGSGVTVYDTTGKQIEHIPVPGWTANVCFGGKDRNRLFITATKSVYIIDTKVRGVQ